MTFEAHSVPWKNPTELAHCPLHHVASCSAEISIRCRHKHASVRPSLTPVSHQVEIVHWVALSYSITLLMSGLVMLAFLIYLATPPRRASLLVCCKSSKRVKYCESRAMLAVDGLRRLF